MIHGLCPPFEWGLGCIQVVELNLGGFDESFSRLTDNFWVRGKAFDFMRGREIQTGAIYRVYA